MEEFCGDFKTKESARQISYILAKMLLEHDLFLSFDPKEKELVFAKREDVNSCVNGEIPVISVPIKDINITISAEESKRKVKMTQDESEE